MTFNILVGGGEQERFELILDVISKACPDLLILQECINWEKSKRLNQVSEIMNAKFSYLGLARPRGTGNCYNVAICSTLPKEEFTSVKTYNNAAFLGHCIVELSLANGLKVFGTHFDSHNENLRFVEARYLRSLINKKDFDNGYYLLAGDLNALSSRDPYPENFAELVKESGNDKYHFPPRFEVIQEIESFGWIDMLYYIPTKKRDWITAPRMRGGVKIDYRTDYIFSSPRLAEKIEKVEIINCENASDHFPIITTFNI